MLPVLLICVCSAQTSVEADPTKYLFYPNSPLHLGGGLSPNDVAAPKTDCFTFEAYSMDGDNTALTTTFSKILVTNAEQLKSALSIDSKIDASYLTFSGGASFSYNTDSTFSDDELTVVLTATTEYSRRGVRNIVLNDIGKRWVGNGAKFADVCGSRFIDVEYVASVTSVIITISQLSDDEKSSVTAQLSAQGGWGPLSGGASAKFNQQLASATGQDRINIQVVSTGGAGLAALGDLLKSLDREKASLSSVEVIEGAMGDYLKTFSSQNAAPVAFDVTPMTFAGWDPNSVRLLTDLQQRTLQQIVAEYRDIATKQDRVRALMAGTDPRHPTLSTQDRNTLSTLDSDYSEYMQKLATAHDTCQTTEPPSCDFPAVPTTWPKNPVPDLPDPPTGYFAITITPPLAPGAFPPVVKLIWDENRSRATLAGINPLTKGVPSPPYGSAVPQATTPSVHIQQILGNDASIMYFLEGTSLEDTVQISYKEDGTLHYLDIGSLTRNTCPSGSLGAKYMNGLANVPGSVSSCVYIGGSGVMFSAGALQSDALDSIFEYVFQKTVPVFPVCTDNSSHSGVFALHIFDDYGRDFHIPIIKASWALDHFWIKPQNGAGCYFQNDMVELDLLQ